MTIKVVAYYNVTSWWAGLDNGRHEEVSVKISKKSYKKLAKLIEADASSNHYQEIIESQLPEIDKGIKDAIYLHALEEIVDACTDWSGWSREHRKAINAIRDCKSLDTALRRLVNRSGVYIDREYLKKYTVKYDFAQKELIIQN